MAAHTLNKKERLCGMTLTEELFDRAGSHSVASFPVRAVWKEMERKEGEPPVRILTSVSKRHFKRAVKRNRVKRQLREAYRLRKEVLYDRLAATPDRAVMLGFLWLADEVYESSKVTASVQKLMQRIAEKL